MAALQHELDIRPATEGLFTECRCGWRGAFTYSKANGQTRIEGLFSDDELSSHMRMLHDALDGLE